MCCFPENKVNTVISQFYLDQLHKRSPCRTILSFLLDYKNQSFESLQKKLYNSHVKNANWVIESCKYKSFGPFRSSFFVYSQRFRRIQDCILSLISINLNSRVTRWFNSKRKNFTWNIFTISTHYSSLVMRLLISNKQILRTSPLIPSEITSLVSSTIE